MQKQIEDQIIKAVGNGQLIRAMKLLREAENIDLKTAKDKIEDLSRQMQNGTIENPYSKSRMSNENVGEQFNQQPKVHTHRPARKEKNNIERELPTEAFLFFQKGEVKEGIRVIRAKKDLGANEATRMAKIFFTDHTEYESDEIEKLMRQGISLSNSRDKSGKKKKSNFISNLIFFIVFIAIVKNFMD